MSAKRAIERMVRPGRLERGDLIGIVAPASSFDPDNFKKGVEKLRSLGFRVKYERSIFSKYWSRSGYDEKRAYQINRMFADKEVKAIFCAKAGYGSIEILSYLDREVICNNPKIFVGYSDITALLLYLQKIADMVVFHGPVLSGEIYEGMNRYTLEYLLRLISEPVPFGVINSPQVQSIRPKKATGILVGGNISLIVDSLNTPYEIDTKDKILFLEDVGEDFKVISNYFLALKKKKKFDKVKGVIFGKMVDCFEHAGKFHSMKDVLSDMFSDFDFPIIFRFPSGHAKEKNEFRVTLPLGVSVTINAQEAALTIDQAAVC